MPQKLLHIVSFDNPYPPVYGGVIEVFYKLKPLQDLGIAVHLHCFVTDIPAQNPALEALVSKVYYYKNTKNLLSFFSWLPFSVQSRTSKTLRDNIKALPAPILFEGLKTTYWCYKNAFPDFRTYLRLHNIEHLYFDGVARSENHFVKRFAYGAEAFKFRRYEKMMGHFDQVLALSLFERDYVQQRFENAVYIPVFHGNEQVSALDGMGTYALYHGDLRLADNRRVAENMIRIFAELPEMQLVVASGAHSAAYFGERMAAHDNMRYETLRDFTHLKDLISGAQLHLIFSYQRSGTKLKLMNALFYGRHCLINENVMDDPEVAQLCHFAASDAEIKAQVQQLMRLPYNDYAARASVLNGKMNDAQNAKFLEAAIFGK